MRGGVEQDRTADDVAVGAEAAAPDGIAQDRHGLALGTPFLFCEGATELRLDSEQGEKVGRDARDRHLQCFAVSGEVEVIVRPYSHRFKRLVAVAYELIARQRHAGTPVLIRSEAHKPIRVTIRKWPQQQRVGHGEDGGVRADPEREGQHGCAGESFAPAQRAGAVSQVAAEGFEKHLLVRGQVFHNCFPQYGRRQQSLRQDEIVELQHVELRSHGFLRGLADLE